MSDKPESVLQAARVWASRWLPAPRCCRRACSSTCRRRWRELLPGPRRDAQRAIQFTRSTPGIAVALVGMGQPEHVRENLGVAPVPPATREQYLRLYQ